MQRVAFRLNIDNMHLRQFRFISPGCKYSLLFSSIATKLISIYDIILADQREIANRKAKISDDTPFHQSIYTQITFRKFSLKRRSRHWESVGNFNAEVLLSACTCMPKCRPMFQPNQPLWSYRKIAQFQTYVSVSEDHGQIRLSWSSTTLSTRMPHATILSSAILK